MAHESSTPISQAPTDTTDASGDARQLHENSGGMATRTRCTRTRAAAAAAAAAHTQKHARRLSAQVQALKGKLRTLETRLETLSKLVNVSIAHFA